MRAVRLLLHAALTMRDLPPDQRAVWHAMFEHLVFTDPEQAMAHLPPSSAACWDRRRAKRTREVRDILRAAFQRPDFARRETSAGAGDRMSIHAAVHEG